MTLSEVLVVVAILGILILLVAFFIRPEFQIGKSRDARRKSDLKKLAIALEDYATDHKCYPNESSGLDVLSPKYIPQIFKDPKTKQPYTYVCSSNGDCGGGTGCTKFAIFTTLESEPGIPYKDGNYVVSSPNWNVAPWVGCYDCCNGYCTLKGYPDKDGNCPTTKYRRINCVGEECCDYNCVAAGGATFNSRSCLTPTP